jgi:hypothetical protein
MIGHGTPHERVDLYGPANASTSIAKRACSLSARGNEFQPLFFSLELFARNEGESGLRMYPFMGYESKLLK